MPIYFVIDSLYSSAYLHQLFLAVLQKEHTISSFTLFLSFWHVLSAILKNWLVFSSKRIWHAYSCYNLIIHFFITFIYFNYHDIFWHVAKNCNFDYYYYICVLLSIKKLCCKESNYFKIKVVWLFIIIMIVF